MARDGSGNFTLPANTQAVSGDPISSTKFNTLVQDLEADANVDRPIAAGGTGASTASAARTNLGLAIGTDVQAFDAGLQSIAGLTTLADRSIYTTASDTYAVYTLTAAGRAILDDADASAQRTTLGLAIGTNVQAFDQQLADIAAMAVTDSGFIVGNGTTFVLETGATVQTSLGYTAADVLSKLLTVDGAGTGLDADLLDGVQPSAFGLTIIDDADASAARTTLGLANGATTTISAFALTMLDDVDAAATRTTLGLGTAALKNTGTSGDAVPLLNAANTFSAAQFVNTTGTAASFSLQRTDDGATGALFDLNHISASPAANDVPATFRALGRDSGNNTTVYGRLRWIVSDPTDTSEDSYWTINSLVAGSEASVLDSLDGTLRFNANTVWHAGNDGAGSGLDADTVDGAHVGTSGAAIPLLNAANMFSAQQAILGNGSLTGADATHRGDIQIINNPTGASQAGGLEFKTSVFGSGYGWRIAGIDPGGGTPLAFYARENSATWTEVMRLTAANVLTVNSNTVWHAGNDGAGSGLDADTLDGVQGSAFARTSGGAITGTLQVTGQANPASGSGIELLYTGSVGFVEAYNWTSSAWLPIAVAGLTCELWANGSARLSISSAGAVTIANTLQARAAASTETTGTLTVASANKTIQATGDITIPNAVFSAGDIILIYAGASARTITQGASVTMRLGGTATTGSRTLAARGVAMLFFVSSSEVIVSGGAVT